jgi:hypothetical protein
MQKRIHGCKIGKAVVPNCSNAEIVRNEDQANNKLINLIKKNCSDCSTTPFLFPYAESRLYSEFENGKKAGGRIQQVFLLVLWLSYSPDGMH